jgi:hypothetical protein
MWHVLYSHRYPTAVYQLHLRHYLDRAEDLLQGHTDGDARMASVDGVTTAGLAEVAEEVEADLMRGDLVEVYHLVNGGEVRHRRSESQALVEEEGGVEAEMTGGTEEEEEDDGSVQP